MRDNRQSPERQMQHEEPQHIPLLHDCITKLKSLGHDSSDLTLKDRGELYLSAVAFLCHLKADQEVLNGAWNCALSERSSAICPLPGSTPAITALLDDSLLFQTMIGLLSSKNLADQDTPSSITAASNLSGAHGPQMSSKGALKPKPGFHQSQQRGNRKRAGSFSGLEKAPETPKQLAKSHLSPGGPNISSMKGIIPSTLLSSNDTQKRSMLDFNLRVFAATIFYAALQHMDHWPFPLIKAYAEDCFGPRLWVDDDRCKLLTDNLSSILSNDGDCDKLDPDTEKAGDKMAELFAKVKRPLTNHIPEDKSYEQPSKKQRIGNECDGTQNLLSNVKGPQKAYHPSSDSDSGDEEYVMEISVGTSLNPLANQKLNRPSTINRKKHKVAPTNTSKDDSGSSSSSGEEYEEEEGKVTNVNAEPLPKRPRTSKENRSIMSEKSNGESSSLPSFSNPPKLSQSRDWYQQSLDMAPVRPRYFGKNRNLAQKAIADALSKRLESKTKQNSRLLSVLPMFTSIPGVRRLAACHLERWLQSPALAGLGRSLFSSIVGAMRNVDPPLSDDIHAIDNILSMKLKVNQLTVHIDNITSIAKTIPTISISRHIFIHLLREEVIEIEKGTSQPDSPSSDHLRMLVAAYTALPPSIAADAMAAAVVSLATDSKEGPPQPVERIRSLLRTVSVALGSSYDGNLLVKSLLDSRGHKSIEDVHITAKIAFECICLIVPLPSSAGSSGSYHRQHSKSHWKGVLASKAMDAKDQFLNDGLSQEDITVISKKLVSIRNIVLAWCVTVLPRVFPIRKTEDDKSPPSTFSTRETKKENRCRFSQSKNSPVGAGAPIFHSVLDGRSTPDRYDFDSSTSKILKITRCMLFLSDPESQELLSFLFSPNETNSIDLLTPEQRYQIRFCCKYGTDVDDSMMRVVLKSAATSTEGISKRLAICLVELLFMSCKQGHTAKLRLVDCSIAWELYNLVEYRPPERTADKVPGSNMEDRSLHTGTERGTNDQAMQNDRSTGPIPRLAYPGDWWRVTAIVLVMCGMSPKTIGSKMWKSHPTLRALIKMTTSGRYKFPTADCDEEQKEKMRQSETKSRDLEAKLAEMLFLPKSKQPKKEKRPDKSFSPHVGSRVSARQRQKQARILARQREQEAKRAHAEAQRIKKTLKACQKSIMLLDPTSTARKPPKESVNLILSVDGLFALSDIFRQCTDPDFLLQTIGCTSRSSIDRAHDWLIPVISSHPRTIDRLPPSASCFLLLRAYGNEADKNNQLLELSAPLLRHVRDCLTGTFGEADAFLAADLLLTDVADPDADRRRCARRVLQEALVDINVEDTAYIVDDVGNCDWLFKLLHVEHAEALMSIAIKHVSHALAYERGRVLRASVLALHKYTEFAKDNTLGGTWNFVPTLCELLSVRPHICSAAMDRFSDFRDLAVKIVHNEFERMLSSNVSGVNMEESASTIRLRIRQVATGICESSKEVAISSQLMRAAIVLISTWQAIDPPKTKVVGTTHENIMSLVNYLLPSSDIGTAFGAAAATFVSNGKRAVPVDQWVMLVKARADFIARNAALSAPNIFLPRLILCCGLPRSSLVTMLEHLGKLGDSSPEPNKCFNQLLAPSATTEWGMGYTGNRRMIARKLLGRLSAYHCIHHIPSNSSDLVPLENAFKSSFVKWLFEEGCSDDKYRKGRLKRGNWNSGGRSKTSSPNALTTLKSPVPVQLLVAERSWVSHTTDAAWHNCNERTKIVKFISDMVTKTTTSLPGSTLSKEVIRKYCSEGDYFLMERQLEEIYFKYTEGSLGVKEASEIARNAMTVYSSEECASFANLVLKWIPLLTQLQGEESLWKTIFALPENISHFELPCTSISLIARCSSLWTSSHIVSCQLWIFGVMKNSDTKHKLSLPLMLRFLVITLDQQSVQSISFNDNITQRKSECLATQENATGAIQVALGCAELLYGKRASPKPSKESSPDMMSLALECVKIYHSESKNSVGDAVPGSAFATSSVSLIQPRIAQDNRNILSDWLILILQIARCGKKHLDLVTKVLLSLLPSSSWEGRVVPVALLRLYAYFPSLMALNDPKLRGILLDAAGENASKWSEWRSPLDSQLSEMIENLSKNPHQRLLQSISDFSKRHPLVVARHFYTLVHILDGDAANFSDKRGRVNEKSVGDFALAKTEMGLVKVTVRHWGYSFTETLWINVMEILMALPGEVIFSCGQKMGLMELLANYLKLIFTQKQISCKDNTPRIREKLSKLLHAFRASSKQSWENWIESKIPEIETWGRIRDILLECKVTGEGGGQQEY